MRTLFVSEFAEIVEESIMDSYGLSYGDVDICDDFSEYCSKCGFEEPEPDTRLKRFVEDEEDVKRLYGWAVEIVSVDGGWMAFESYDDAEVWQNQN